MSPADRKSAAAGLGGTIHELIPGGTLTLSRTENTSPRSRDGARASTDPSAATARLQVSYSACHLAGLLPAPKAHSDRPGFGHLDRAGHAGCLTSDGRSRAPRCRKGECQLEEFGPLIAFAAKPTSLPSQQTTGRPTACLGRSLPIRCASSCHASTRGRACACRAWSATGTFDAAVFLAPGRLVWLS